MALFKIEKGLAANLAANRPKANEGYAYFTTDDGKFYIDISGNGTQNAVIGTNRICLNAAHADSASTAVKLANNLGVGSITRPVYFSNGLPSAIGHDIESDVPANAIFTDQNVKQNVKSNDATYNLLFTNTANLSTNKTEEVAFSTGITVNPSTNILSATEFDGHLKTNNLIPIQSKTYPAYTCAADNEAKGVIFFGKVNINNAVWQDAWVVHYRLYVSTSEASTSGWYDCYYSVHGSTVQYYHYNNFYSTSYRPIYNHRLLYPKNNYTSYGGYIGVRVQSSRTPTTLARVYKIEILETQNCTIELFDDIKRFDEIYVTTNGITSSTIWNNSDYNATGQGLQETGDIGNDTGYYILSNGFRITAGTTYKIWRYSLFGQISDGTYESYVTSSSNGTSKTKNPHGFLPTGKIYWNSASGTDYSGVVNISPYQQYHSIDYRYTFNITTTGIPASAQTYLKWTYNSDDGLLYLADEWLATALPTTSDGFIYQRIGSNYYGSADYRASLLLENPYYIYENNGIKVWLPPAKANQLNHNLTLKINTGTTEDTDLYTFNGSTNKTLDIKAGDNVTFSTSTAGELVINSSFTNTDTKVTQTAVTHTSYSNWRPLIWGASNSATEDFSPSTVTDQVYTAKNLSVQPSTGTIKATTFKGSLTGNASSATAFSSNATVALTGDVTGTSAGSTKSWSVATTIANGAVTNAKLANSSISIAGNSVSLGGSLTAATLKSSLGLNNAMHYVGITTTPMSDNLTTAVILIDNTNYTPNAGDVTIYDDSEYVWSGSKWERLGRDTSFKVVQEAVSSPSASGNALAFLDTITQDANGKITATKKNVQTANTSQKGVVQLTGTYSSSDTTYAATGKAIAAALATLSAGTGLSLSGLTFNHSNNVTAKTSYPSQDTAASANGGTITVRDFTYDTEGHITASNDRTITLSQTTYTLSGLGGVGTVSASGTAPLTLSASKSGTTVTITGSVANFVKSGSTAAAGLVPKPPTTAGTTKFLREDGTWVVPNYTDDTDRYVNSAAFADDTNNSVNSPIKMTLTRAGSDTATVTANIPKVSSTGAGVAPKGAAVSSQTQTTKFLREDGTWAAPSYTTNTNTTYSAGTGLSLSGTTFNHSNSVTAQTTQAIYPIKIDAQGHISGYGTAVVPLTAHANNYGKITPANSTATTALTGNTTAVESSSSHENLKVSAGNKWIVLAGTNSSTAGSDELKIAHTAGLTAKTAYGSTATTASANGGTIVVTDIKYDQAGHITASTDRTITLSTTHKYWANIEATSAASYNKAPEMATIKLNGNTSASAASTKNVTLQYDSTLEVLNFVFA